MVNGGCNNLIFRMLETTIKAKVEDISNQDPGFEVSLMCNACKKFNSICFRFFSSLKVRFVVYEMPCVFQKL